MPVLAGATAWLNTEPLGHGVPVNFWTLTCINWLRHEPSVRAWSQTYRNDGLVVIAVHTPQFVFEHDIDRVRQATGNERSTTRSPSARCGRHADRLRKAGAAQ